MKSIEEIYRAFLGGEVSSGEQTGRPQSRTPGNVVLVALGCLPFLAILWFFTSGGIICNFDSGKEHLIDQLTQAIAGSTSSLTALSGSTEEEQFNKNAA